MLHKTKGIVLKTTVYSESSVIARIFTEKFGMQSYLINGVKKPKAKIPMNFLQPLHLLELVVYHKNNTQLQRVAEAAPAPVYRTIPYQLVKNTMIQFINEVFYKSVHQESSDSGLFEFVYHALCWFDETEEINVNFHLAFLMKLTKYLGFAPHFGKETPAHYFDLQEGVPVSGIPSHPYYVDMADAQRLHQLFFTPFERLQEIEMTNAGRRLILDKILVYYALHTASFGQVKSHQILEAVLS